MFTMDNEYSHPTWVGNMFHKFEAVCQEVEGFVNKVRIFYKDTVKFVENHMQTVGETVKQFYSDVVQDILLPVVGPLDIVDSNTNKSDADVDSIQQEGDINSDTHNQENLAVDQSPCKENDDPTAKIACEYSENHLDKRSETESESTVYEDADCGIESSINKKNEVLNVFKDIISLENVSTESVVDDLWINCSQEEKVLEFDSEVCRIVLPEKLYDSEDDQCIKLGELEPEKSSVYSENKEECRIVLPEKLYDTEDDQCVKLAEFELEKSSVYSENKEECPIVLPEHLYDSEDDQCLKLAEFELEKPSVYSENKEECPVDFLPEKLYDSEDDQCLKLAESEQEKSNVYSENKVGHRIDFLPEKLYDSEYDQYLKLAGCELEKSSVYSENKEEHCIDFLPEKLYDSEDDQCVKLAEFELEKSSVYSENKEECRIDFLPEKLYDSEDNQCFKLAEFKASGSCLKTEGEGSFTVDVEELDMDTIDLSDEKTLVESCVIVEGDELYTFSNKSRGTKSYKKIIQDAFMSRKRVATEYKQLAIWYGDINEKFIKPKENTPSNIGSTPKSTAQDSCDSEWELV